jgi:hypothetical protein
MAIRNKVHVRIHLDKIVCYDEGDGAGNAEPYLWTVFYKIDGDGVRLGANGQLQGRAIVYRTVGSHGNLHNTNVDAGDTVSIPLGIGAWSTDLKPIPVDPAMLNIVRQNTGWDDLPGRIGVICILMEEDQVTDNAAEAGHRALDFGLEKALNDRIPRLGILKQFLTLQDEQEIQNELSASTKQAVKDELSLLQKLWAFIDPDDTIGSQNFGFNQDILARDGRLSFNQRWDGRLRDAGGQILGKTGDGDWEIFGSVSAEVIPFPKAYQIVCIRSSERNNKPYRISSVGVLENGHVKLISKSEVIRMIAVGNSFHVIGSDGSRSEVYVHHPLPGESINYKFLYTSSDGNEKNNLSYLSQCTL